ncbi:hypothetical protein DFQ01_10610 [Paenibacillus cellulosilyticus]|uniref:Uncharacterized protein n=1 Tax=Paenibacillus cellulosilyticus TaxID=375489 RepID=A0A2V2YV48_9BACL|nr:hypothetical protein DFQ01_10610 [Paenibacillus cellulosilyticus]
MMACVLDTAVCPTNAVCISTQCSGGSYGSRTFQYKFYYNCDGVCTLTSQYNLSCC